MNAEVLIIKGLISEMPEEDKQQINLAYDRLKALLSESGQHGILAFTLVVSEM